LHYYKFNIADYRKDTQHLTPIEHYIYRELMDWYYLDESPIVNDSAKITRRVRLGYENEQLLQNVLDDFFTLDGDYWVHSRIEYEIDQYRANVENARVNGGKGGRPRKPRKTQPVNLANPDVTQTKANHKPLTNIDIPNGISSAETPKRTRKVFKPPSVQDVAEYFAEKNITTIDPDYFVDFYATRGWKLSSGTKMADWKAAVRTWIKREDKSHAQNRPGSNTGAHQPKLTPAQRTAAKREQLRRSQSSDMGAVAAHGGDIRPPVGLTTG